MNPRPRWWEFPWREIGSFGLGAFLLVWQAAFEEHAQALLVGAGLACIGVTGAGAIQRAVKRAIGGE